MPVATSKLLSHYKPICIFSTSINPPKFKIKMNAKDLQELFIESLLSGQIQGIDEIFDITVISERRKDSKN